MKGVLVADKVEARLIHVKATIANEEAAAQDKGIIMASTAHL